MGKVSYSVSTHYDELCRPKVPCPILFQNRDASRLLVAYGDSPILVKDVGIAAAGGNAHILHKTLANCRRQ